MKTTEVAVAQGEKRGKLLGQVEHVKEPRLTPHLGVGGHAGHPLEVRGGVVLCGFEGGTSACPVRAPQLSPALAVFDCDSCLSEDGSRLLWKALACPKVHAAVTAMLVKALLVARALEVLEEGTRPHSQELHFSPQDLKGAVLSVHGLLGRHGMAPTVSTATAPETTSHAFPWTTPSLLPPTEKDLE